MERVEVERWIHHYAAILDLDLNELKFTTNRREFEGWLGRRVESRIGGAYVYLPRLAKHAVLIQVARLNLQQPNAIEVVVAEELIHMRDWIDGDRRRHAKHGYDRIARRVAQLTGASMEDIRSAMLAPEQRPVRYLYECPTCSRQVWRRRRGTWSCGRCASRFDPRHQLRLVQDLKYGEIASHD